jgi:hypothetical protein
MVNVLDVDAERLADAADKMSCPTDDFLRQQINILGVILDLDVECEGWMCGQATQGIYREALRLRGRESVASQMPDNLTLSELRGVLDRPEIRRYPQALQNDVLRRRVAREVYTALGTTFVTDAMLREQPILWSALCHYPASDEVIGQLLAAGIGTNPGEAEERLVEGAMEIRNRVLEILLKRHGVLDEAA